MKEITPESIKAAIVETALIEKRKKELHEEVRKIENELKTLNESHIGMIGSFGFAAPKDISNKTKTGFVNDFQNISHIAQLDAEMASKSTSNHTEPISEDIMNEFARMKEQLAQLQKENEELKQK